MILDQHGRAASTSPAAPAPTFAHCWAFTCTACMKALHPIPVFYLTEAERAAAQQGNLPATFGCGCLNGIPTGPVIPAMMPVPIVESASGIPAQAPPTPSTSPTAP